MRSTLLMTVATVLLVAGGAPAGQTPGTAPPANSTMTERMPMADHHQMMAGHQKMMADMQAADRKLDELVTLMNTARGADRIDRIAGVVNGLVAAHRQMGKGMVMRNEMMMAMPGGQMPMDNCPMMPNAAKDGATHEHDK